MSPVEKTLLQKVEDLEDHTFLLAQALAGLGTGEKAHLRHLAAELRVLVCFSSKIEGLLWRLMDEFRCNDQVLLHEVGNIDVRHPLARGLRYAFCPLATPGEGDPQRPVVAYSLRDLIKTHEAVFVGGRGVTHERLIKWVSEQMGSAHEGDLINPVLAELNAIFVSEIQPFFMILHTDGVLTLSLCERILQFAATHISFNRRHPCFTGATVSLPERKLALTSPLHAPSLNPLNEDEGTISFWLHAQGEEWKDLASGCTFPPFTAGPVTIEATKHPGGYVELRTTGLFIPQLTCRAACTTIGESGIMVAVAWSRPKIVVYVNGLPIQTFWHVI